VFWEGQGQEQPSQERGKGIGAERRHTVLLCGGEDFCTEVRRHIERRRRDVQAVAARGLESAREILEAGEMPVAILTEERVLADGEVSPYERRQEMTAALLLLASYAPVVWIGSAEDAAEISPVTHAAAVDFVPRSALCVPAAVSMVERRLRRTTATASVSAAILPEEQLAEGREFGELLRHELNNPLTGILGNAELLMLEVRRGRLELPAHTLQRVQTITDLAVRMREAVRLLSDRWEAAGGNLSAKEQPSVEQPHWLANS